MRHALLIAVSAAALAAVAPQFALAQAADGSPNQSTQAEGPAPVTGPNVQYTSTDTLGNVATMKAGDPNVVSNAPVADTPQNRQEFGAPLSRAGKMTKPTGD